MEVKIKRRMLTEELVGKATLLLIGVLMVCSQIGYAIPNTGEIQEKITITGKVVDSNGETIVGVNVLIKGTTTGVVTDVNGNYSIQANQGDVLVFSFVGMMSQEVVVGTSNVINITLPAVTADIDELVVVGYGTIKKSNLTGAVSVVKSDDIKKVAVTTAGEALQGRLAGVSVTSVSGQPGAGVDIKIRGVGSFGANSPLYIIDGVQGDLDYVNPDDIASIEVLKDASTAAIYGSRAGNGVILVTTKSGKTGESKVTFSSYTGVQRITKTLDLVDANGFLQVNKMAWQNRVAFDGNDISDESRYPVWQRSTWNHLLDANTDWQNAVFQRGKTQNFNVNVIGGTDKNSYLVSGNFFDQTGTSIGSSYRKYNFRYKGEIKKGRLTLSPNLSYFEDKMDNHSFSFTEVRKISPIIPVFDETRENGYGYNSDLGGENQVGRAHFINDIGKSVNYITSLGINLNLLEGLNAKVNTSVTNNSYNTLYNYPSYKISKNGIAFPYVSEYNYRELEYLVEPQVSYDKTFGKNNFTLLVGGTYYKNQFRDAKANVEGKDADGNRAGFSEDENFNTLNAGNGGTYSGTGTEGIYTRLSIFTRLNYTYNEKYLVQLTLRRDGSSKFGKNNAWGTFPSLSLGWNIHKEPFFEPLTSIVNSLKFRASYGLVGSDANLGFYDYAAVIKSGAGYPLGTSQSFIESKYVSDLENRSLKWEEVESKNIGFDFAILSNKLSGSVNYYINKRTDMLLTKPVPYSAGIANPRVNIGSMQNQGGEFELSYKDSYNGLSWGINAMLFTVKNKVLKLSSKDAYVLGSNIDFTEPATKSLVGDPVGSFYLYQMDGIFQSQAEVDAYNANGRDEFGDPAPILPDAQPGDVRFKDVNGDGKLDAKDKIFSGSGIPKYEYSLNFSVEYKGVDLNIFMQGAGGHKIYNTTKYFTENMKTNFNYATSTLNAWTVNNPNNIMPRAIIGDPNKNSRPSTRFLEDGDYLRIKNIQLGYTIPSNLVKRAKVEKLRLYVSAQNVITFTNYSGYSPEAVERGDVWNTGIDFGGYPIASSYQFGIELTF